MTPRLKMQFAAKTDKGTSRHLNEDAVFVQVSSSMNRAVLVVADGLGGHDCGDVASRLVVESLSNELNNFLEQPQDSQQELVESLRLAIEKANLSLYQHQKWQRDCGGSTVACVLIQNDLAVIGMVEDCWVYLLRDNNLELLINPEPYESARQRKGVPHLGQLVLINKIEANCLGIGYDIDFHWWERLAGNEMEEVEANWSDFWRADFFLATIRYSVEELEEVTNYINKGVTRLKKIEAPEQSDLKVPAHFCVQRLQAGDKLLLCSDGLWSQLEDSEITQLLQEAETPEIAVELLITSANEQGTPDNITAIVCEIMTW